MLNRLRNVRVSVRRLSTISCFENLEKRGFIHQTSKPAEEMKTALDTPIRLYAGFDPTAPSLHLGNLSVLMMQAHLLRHGHSPVVLVRVMWFWGRIESLIDE